MSILPIAATPIDLDLFVMARRSTSCPGTVIWLAGREIDRFPDFREYFLAMMDYNRQEVRELSRGSIALASLLNPLNSRARGELLCRRHQRRHRGVPLIGRTAADSHAGSEATRSPPAIGRPGRAESLCCSTVILWSSSRRTHTHFPFSLMCLSAPPKVWVKRASPFTWWLDPGTPMIAG